MDLIPDVPDSVLRDPYAAREAYAAPHVPLDDEDGVLKRARQLLAEPQSARKQTITPATTTAAAGNALRPSSFGDIVGQERAKDLLRRLVAHSKRSGEPLEHCLFVGPSGTGKTTFAHVCANELGKRVFQLEAPVSADTLLELREAMDDGDILFLDEIHQQAIAERRGKSSSTQPEVLFSIMEDFTLPTQYGVLDFPRITFFGATTDEGALPDAFVNRFPVRPPLARYLSAELELIANASAEKLGGVLTKDAARIFGSASRGVPREVNNYVKQAIKLSGSGVVRRALAQEILDFAGVTEDGLTRDMQGMLTFLYQRAKRTRAADGETTYQASVSTIATAIGKSRDVKAIQLRVEPYLIEQGYVQVGHGGRWLTDAGIDRARELLP
jgi:Holliday junction DNA helicase RuvB